MLALALPAGASANDYLDQLTPAQRAEFDANRGLAAINAQYAYARGLSGAGQVLGIVDSGVAPNHPELAGRVTGIAAGALRPDGSRCDNGTLLAGPSACFYTEGTQPAVTYLDWDRALAESLLTSESAKSLEEANAYGRFENHGTHVAGIMAAARDGQGMHGVAPGSSLASVKLFSDAYTNTASFLNEAAGTPVFPGELTLSQYRTPEFMAQAYGRLGKAGVRVVNNSWAYPNEAPGSVGAVDQQAKQFAAELDSIAGATLRYGMLQVVAGGNDGSATVDVPAALPRYKPELQPYWLSVISVAADGTLDSFSNGCGLSRDWCVAAPGAEIKSSVIEGLANAQPVRDASGAVVGLQVAREQTPTYKISPLSGTSMAAPHVTGALSLLIERFPYLNNPQVRDVLLTTATDLGAPGVDDVFGWGLINLRKAIDGPGMLRVD
ncbi:MAG TPA: S8 family peptidase, partial [Stenotrophomonas sp.]|nr:S8 family peptidase [Stenotrophomonas sp.]